MAETVRQIGEEAFYRMVGGENAEITRAAGLSVIARLIAVQIRDALGVDPRKIDRGTMDLIHSVDEFYMVKHGKFNKPRGDESHTAREFFERSGIGQDGLQEIRAGVDKLVNPIEEKGVVGKLLGKYVRERQASVLSRRAVAEKVRSVFKG